MTLLNNDHKGILWCGPAAISMVTGHKVSAIIALHKELTGKRTVSAMSNAHMMEIMKRLGWAIDDIDWYLGAKMTVAQVIHKFAGRCAIMATAEHFFVSMGNGRVADNCCTTPVALYRSGLADGIMEHAIVWKPTGAAPRFATPPPAVDATDKNLLSQARKLAREYGIDLERDQDVTWVTHPNFEDDENDPLMGEHCAYNGEQTLQKVMTYVQALQLQTV